MFSTVFWAAAQKTVENIIGAITLYTSAPIKVGNFCRFDNHLGIVEEIGLRSTRIRTIERTVIYVANAKFIDMNIENFSEREKMAIFSRSEKFSMFMSMNLALATYITVLSIVRIRVDRKPISSTIPKWLSNRQKFPTFMGAEV